MLDFFSSAISVFLSRALNVLIEASWSGSLLFFALLFFLSVLLSYFLKISLSLAPNPSIFISATFSVLKSSF